MVWIQNQLEMAPIGYNVSLTCSTEAYPAAIHLWTYYNGTAIATGGQRFYMEETSDGLTTTVKLIILRLEKGDFGKYVCVAKNSLGKQDGVITLEGTSSLCVMCFFLCCVHYLI